MVEKKTEKLLAKEPDPSYKRRAGIIFDNLELEEGSKLVDIGCGRGFYLKALKKFWPKLKITGVDLNEKYLEETERNLVGLRVKLIKANAEKLPFADNSFDRIIVSEVLEHVSDDRKALAEIHRVLKPAGIAMISVPNANYPLLWDPLNWFLEKCFEKHIPSNIWWLAGIWAYHKRLYEKKDLTKKIKEAGLKIEKSWQTTHYCLPLSHFLLYGIWKNLVEKGFLSDINRFSDQGESRLSKVLLWPIRLMDKLNQENEEECVTTVNLIYKIVK